MQNPNKHPELPSAYLNFLAENPDGRELTLQQSDQHRITSLNLFGESQLHENLEMTGMGSAANFECLKLFIKFQRDYGYADSDAPQLDASQLLRVEAGFVIGGDYDGYVYLDSSDNFSVWLYFPEDGRIAKVADSFEDLMQNKLAS